MKTFNDSVLLMILLLMSVEYSVSQTFTNYTVSEGLPDDNVLAVAVDQNNNKWFGTQSGVARFDGSTWTVYTTADGLIDNYINCICADGQNHIWAGTDVGVSYYDGEVWKSFTTADGLINNTISYITSGLDAKVYIGTGAGFSVYNGETFTNYNSADGLPSEMISYLATDGSNNLWIGTWIGGLARFDGTSFQVFTMNEGLPDNNITAIAIDNIGNKYIGTFSGIALFDADNKYVTTFTSSNGLLMNPVKDLAIDSHSRLWAGEYADYLQQGGFGLYDLSKWFSYTTADGLVNTLVRRIAVDKNDHIWIATGNGVSDFFPGYFGIVESLPPDISIYPNPAHDILVADGIKTGSLLVISDLSGRIQLSAEMTGYPCKLDVSSLIPGLYLMAIEESEKKYYSRIVIH